MRERVDLKSPVRDIPPAGICEGGAGQLASLPRPNYDPGKVQIGLRLRRETPLSVKPISERLRLDTVSSASVRLLSAARQPTASQPAQAGLPI